MCSELQLSYSGGQRLQRRADIVEIDLLRMQRLRPLTSARGSLNFWLNARSRRTRSRIATAQMRRAMRGSSTAYSGSMPLLSRRTRNSAQSRPPVHPERSGTYSTNVNPFDERKRRVALIGLAARLGHVVAARWTPNKNCFTLMLDEVTLRCPPIMLQRELNREDARVLRPGLPSGCPPAPCRAHWPVSAPSLDLRAPRPRSVHGLLLGRGTYPGLLIDRRVHETSPSIHRRRAVNRHRHATCSALHRSNPPYSVFMSSSVADRSLRTLPTLP